MWVFNIQHCWDFLYILAYDCYDIGVFVFMAGHTRIALQWLQTAKEKANNLDFKKETTISADLNDLIKEIERQVNFLGSSMY